MIPQEIEIIPLINFSKTFQNLLSFKIPGHGEYPIYHWLIITWLFLNNRSLFSSLRQTHIHSHICIHTHTSYKSLLFLCFQYVFCFRPIKAILLAFRFIFRWRVLMHVHTEQVNHSWSLYSYKRQYHIVFKMWG